MQMWKLVRNRRSIKEKGRLATAVSHQVQKIRSKQTQLKTQLDTQRYTKIRENRWKMKLQNQILGKRERRMKKTLT